MLRYRWSGHRATARAWFRRFADTALEERPWLAVLASWEELAMGEVASVIRLADIAERGTFGDRPPDGTASSSSASCRVPSSPPTGRMRSVAQTGGVGRARRTGQVSASATRASCPMTTSEEALRRLTIADPAYCRALLATGLAEPTRALDLRSVALLQLGGMIAAGSDGPMWQQCVGEALDAGWGFDEIVASLEVLAPSIGLERVVAVAPLLARALGYDVDAALEELHAGSAPATRRPREAAPTNG